jgi:hypothetical protein
MKTGVEKSGSMSLSYNHVEAKSLAHPETQEN